MSEELLQFYNKAAAYQEAKEIKNNTEKNEAVFPWADRPSLPIPVSSSFPSSDFDGGVPSHSQQQFVPTNNIDSSFSLPDNGNGFGNGHPNTLNSIQNDYNSYVIPIPNTGRFLTRPETHVTIRNSTVCVRKLKRNRTAFTAMQMMVLEQEYKKNNFLDRGRRTSVAEMLGLNERIIKIWFQNRRMKDKKVKLDTNNLEEEASSTTGIPFFIQSQQMGNVVNRNMFVEQYSNPSTSALPMPMLNQLDQTPIVFNPPYIPEEYDPYQKQVHLHIKHYGPPPAYSNRFQEIVDDPPPIQEELAPSLPHNIVDSNVDISWVDNINIDEDC